MAAPTRLDRWLKDADRWVEGDDWDAKEYFSWVQRLADAKANLDETFLESDKALLEQIAAGAKTHNDAVRKVVLAAGRYTGMYEKRPAGILARYIVAYNFFGRAQFEEITDKALVSRVQLHLVKMELAMRDVDVANMLQYAAEGVALKKALVDELQKFVDKHKDSYIIEGEVKYHDDESTPGFEDETPRFVQLLHAKRVANGGSIHVADITPISNQINEELAARGADKLTDKQMAKMVKVLNTDARLTAWLESRQEPLLVGESEDWTTVLCIDDMLKTGDIESLADHAVAWEKTNCSWESTIGPAVKALRRLGRTSAGKDHAKLAQYAKEHAKPS